VPRRASNPAATALPRRQVWLFLVAVLTPCLVLVGLSLRTLEQERQLQEKRSADEHQRRVAQLRQELSNHLDRVRLDLASSASVPPDELVAFAGSLRAGQLVLPWDESAEIRTYRDAASRPAFLRELQKGAQEEAGGSAEKAIGDYRQAVKAAGHPAAQALARLSLARVLMKAGRRKDGLAEYASILKSSPDIVDEQGIPLSLYAVPPLLEAGAANDEALRLIRATVESPKWWSPAGLYMLRDLARSAGARDLDSELTEQAYEREQAEALQRDFATLMPVGRAVQLSWVPYGDAPWLVGIVAHASSPESSVIALRLRELLTRTDSYMAGIRLASGQSGELLGDPFTGTRVTVPVSKESSAYSRMEPFILALVIALAVTLFAGYLTWRDVRRELRLAAMRSQFVASVSHELKTPLTAIRMFAEASRMHDGLDRSSLNQNLDTIIQEADRLRRLVDNVLDFARIEQGRKTYPMRPTSLADVVRSAVGAMQYSMAQSGFRLTLAVDDSLPPILADRDALEQAILNLLDNAMKYSGDSRDMELRLSHEDEYGVVRVVDHGPGIPESERSRIFERFYRISSPENDRLPGAGLGLTLVDHIVKAHGGSVGVESLPGQGSTFTIRLPLRSEA